LGTKYLVVLCAGFTLPLAKQSLDEAPYKLSGAVAKLVGITFSRLAFSYWIDNLGFITEGKTCCYIHQTLLLGFSNWPVIYYTQSSFLTSSSRRHQQVFLAPLPGIEEEEFPTSTTRQQNAKQVFLALLPGRKKTSARGVSHAHPLLCFKFCFYFIFTCIVLSKT
jgi:hypothetical protein